MVVIVVSILLAFVIDARWDVTRDRQVIERVEMGATSALLDSGSFESTLGPSLYELLVTFRAGAEQYRDDEVNFFNLRDEEGNHYYASIFQAQVRSWWPVPASSGMPATSTETRSATW